MASAPPIEDDIACNICFEICENPHCLKCLHFFCNNCVQKMKQGTTIQCPECRETCSMSEVKKDFRIEKILDINLQHTAADKDMRPIIPTVCDVYKNYSKPAKSFCKECNETVRYRLSDST